jgi:hypothetical protein
VHTRGRRRRARAQPYRLISGMRLGRSGEGKGRGGVALGSGASATRLISSTSLACSRAQYRGGSCSDTDGKSQTKNTRAVGSQASWMLDAVVSKPVNTA